MLSTKGIMEHFRSGRSIMDTICDFIIRPPRCPYTIDSLGPKVFRFGGSKERYKRDDIELENMRGMTIQCSWFRPLTGQCQSRRLPCVVYCHANCGSRYDGMEALFLLKHGFTLFTFDFCGSGMSDGEYISLGFYERQDLAAVVEYLNSKSTEVDGIALWGRSMGAVTSIMYASKDSSIRCVVCDSPFASLRQVIRALVAQNGGRTARMIPKAIISNVVERIRKRIARRAAFDIDDLDTIKYASECAVPGLLFHGEDDEFVSPSQSMEVRDAFVASCLHILVEGGHNDERDKEIQNMIIGFIRLYTVEKPRAAREQSGSDAPPAINVSAEVTTRSGLTSYEVVTGKQPLTDGAASDTQSATSASNQSGESDAAGSSAESSAHSSLSRNAHEESMKAPMKDVEPLTEEESSLDLSYFGATEVQLSAMPRPQPIAFAKEKLTSAPTDCSFSASQ